MSSDSAFANQAADELRREYGAGIVGTGIAYVGTVRHLVIYRKNKQVVVPSSYRGAPVLTKESDMPETLGR